VTVSQGDAHVEGPSRVPASRLHCLRAGVCDRCQGCADHDHDLDGGTARGAAHSTAAGHRRDPFDAVPLHDPGDRADAAHLLGDRIAVGPHHRLELRHDLGDRARRRLLSDRRHGRERIGQRGGDADARLGHHAAPDAPDGLEQLRLLRRQHHAERSHCAGAGVENDASAVRLEHRRHRLPLVRSRGHARQQRPLPPVDLEVPVRDGNERAQDGRRPGPRAGARVRNPHHARYSRARP